MITKEKKDKIMDLACDFAEEIIKMVDSDESYGERGGYRGSRGGYRGYRGEWESDDYDRGGWRRGRDGRYM